MKHLLYLCLLVSISVSAQPGLVLYDLSKGLPDANPEYLTEYNNKLFFYTYDSTEHFELWSFDGFSQPVKVDNVGKWTPRIFRGHYRPMAVVGSRLYFVMNTDSVGSEIYSYDGIHAPVLVKDIYPGPGNSFPDWLLEFDDKLYFIAANDTFSNKLWCHDPVTGHTFPVTPSYRSDMSDLTFFQDDLYFVATDTFYPSKLHAYDPVKKQTRIIGEIASGNKIYAPLDLYTGDAKLYFSAASDEYGRELYEYDGINVPVRITDILQGPPDGVSYLNIKSKLFCYFLGRVYLSGRKTSFTLPGGLRPLFGYDPTTRQTFEIKSPNDNSFDLEGDKIAYADKLFFSATDFSGSGYQVWSYDKLGQLKRITDIYYDGNGCQPFGFFVFHNSLYFTAGDSLTGFELYKYTDPMYAVKTNSIQVYPNPASSVCYMNISMMADTWLDIQLTDALGRRLYSSGYKKYPATSSTTAIPLAHLSPACYFYYVRNSNNRILFSGKIIKN